jgi:hypothetical protein
MTAVVWANVLLTIPFLIAWIGIPLWMTFRHPDTGPGHTQAQAYLRARAARAGAGTPVPGRFTGGVDSHRAAA